MSDFPAETIHETPESSEEEAKTLTNLKTQMMTNLAMLFDKIYTSFKQEKTPSLHNTAIMSQLVTDQVQKLHLVSTRLNQVTCAIK